MSDYNPFALNALHRRSPQRSTGLINALGNGLNTRPSELPTGLINALSNGSGTQPPEVPSGLINALANVLNTQPSEPPRGLINTLSDALSEHPYIRLANALRLASSLPIAASYVDLGPSRLTFDVYSIEKLPHVSDAIYIATRSQMTAGWPSEYVGQTKRPVATRFDEHARESPLWRRHSTHLHVMVVKDDCFRSVLETKLIDLLDPPGNRVRGPLARFI